MQLIQPTINHLDSHLKTLEQGWNPLYYKNPASPTLIEAIKKDPDRFIALHTDPTGELCAQKFSENTKTPSIPSMTIWMWDGDYAGSIDFRWQHGTTDFPIEANGHIVYAVPP